MVQSTAVRWVPKLPGDRKLGLVAPAARKMGRQGIYRRQRTKMEGRQHEAKPEIRQSGVVGPLHIDRHHRGCRSADMTLTP
jgi:hypothetical protein